MQNDKTPTGTLQGAERAFLGSLMLDATQVIDTAGIITGPMFTNLADEIIYDAIIYTATATGTTDPIVVADYLTQTGQMHEIPGGPGYLHELYSTPSSPALAPHYAQVITDAYQARKFNASLHAALSGLERGLSASELMANLLKDIDEQTLQTTGAPTLIGEELADTAQTLQDGAGGISTGIRDFDNRFGGLGKSTMSIWAGRAGMGKTAVALSFARNIARQGIPVLFYSLEMSKMQMLTRILCAECRIPTDRMNLINPKLTEDDWERISQRTTDILNLPLYVEDTAGLTIEQIVSQVKAFRRKYPEMVLFIDYIGLVDTVNKKSYTNERDKLGHISRTLKNLSRSEDIPVQVLAQLNRQSESRADHTPQISDLRGSGDLEQDADNVFLLYREDYYEPESPRAGEVDIIGAKVRAGSPGTVALAAQMHYMNVCDMAID